MSDADFAGVARIEACLNLGAWFAHRRIVDRIGVAATRARRILRAEPDGVVDAWELAAAKAVAAVRGERSAIASVEFGVAAQVPNGSAQLSTVHARPSASGHCTGAPARQPVPDGPFTLHVSIPLHAMPSSQTSLFGVNTH